MPNREALLKRLQPLEAEYRAAMVSALQECASGRWGLFGHNERSLPKADLPRNVEGLIALAESINAVRARIGLEPFALHERLWAMRGPPADANAPGEPKQAQAWLKELGEW